MAKVEGAEVISSNRFHLTIHLPIVPDQIDLTITLPHGAAPRTHFVSFNPNSRQYHDTAAMRGLAESGDSYLQDAATLALAVYESVHQKAKEPQPTPQPEPEPMPESPADT